MNNQKLTNSDLDTGNTNLCVTNVIGVSVTDNAGYIKHITYYMSGRKEIHSTSVVFDSAGMIKKDLVDFTTHVWLDDVVHINGDAWRDLESSDTLFDFYFEAKTAGLEEAQCYLEELHFGMGKNGIPGQVIY